MNLLILLLPQVCFAQTKIYTAGAYIIDMGQPTQTIANGLKPYGLVYALIQAGIPVDWAIEPSKAKDGIDFNVNSKNYKGGPFIIPSELITSAVLTLFTSWHNAGVIIDGPIPVGFTTTIYKTLTIWPRAFLDLDNDGLITPYYANAGIPSSSYLLNANPTMLPQCGSTSGTQDVYILPHADPQNWNAAWVAALQGFINNGGGMWAGCHAVSAMENIPGCNFLSNNGLVLWGNHGNGTPTPSYIYLDSGDPLMQFMGILDGATSNGSEEIYVPSVSGWRTSTTIAVYDQGYTNASITYPNTAGVVVYGPAFGTKGLVMYEAGHSLGDNNSNAQEVAAQRAFFNFLLLAGGQSQTNVTPPNVSNQTTTACSGTAFTVTPSGAPANITYTWLAPTGTGFTGGSAQIVPQNSINQILTNTTTSTVTAVYTVTPRIGGCIGNLFTLTVSVNPLPTVNVSPSSPAICIGNSTTLTASGGINYSWSPATGLSGTTGATVTANPTSTTTYTVAGTDANGCVNSASVTLTVNKSNVTVGAIPNPVCIGSALNLTSSNTFISSVLLSENFNGATNSWTKINNSAGGTPADAAWILRANGYAIPDCSSDNTVLHSNDNSQFYLSNSCEQGDHGITATILQSPAISTVGYTTLTLNFYHYFKFYAVATAKVEVSINGTSWSPALATYTSTKGTGANFAPEIINLNSYIGNAIFYIRFKYDAPWSWYWAIDNVSLSGTVSSPISWTGPAGFTSAVQNPTLLNVTQTNAGIYTVTYTDPVTTCPSSNSVTVNVSALPTISVTPTSPAICIGNSTILTASGAVTYSWTPATGLSAITGQTVTANPLTTTTYTVTGTDANGCTNTALVEVAVNSLPTISLTPALATICRGSSTSLTASGATSYSWAPSTGLSAITGATVIASPVTTTTYTVTGTNAAGCTNTEAVTVTVIPSPVTTGVTTCPGGTGSLTSSSTCPPGSSVTVGPLNAGAGSSPLGSGTVAWSNPGNAISNNSSYATAHLPGHGTETSDYLRTTNYNFTIIPNNAIVVGIAVAIGRFENDIKAGNDVKDVGVYLLKAGVIVGNNYADIATEWPKNTLTAATYGGNSDLWGTTWTVADIQASNFGVSLNVNSDNDRTASVDYIQISVTYALPGTLNWYTASSGGILLGSGSPFNPVGVANSGLPNTIIAGTYTFYAECSSDNRCRTATNFIINPSPAITAMASNVCSGSPFTVTPVNGTNGVVPAGTTYSWGAPIVTGGLTGGAASSGTPSGITGTLSNPTNTSQTASYTVTPTSGSCTGGIFTVTVTLPAALNPGSINTTGGNYCNGGNANINGTSSPYGAASGGNTLLSYQWEQSYQAGTGCSGSWTVATGTNNGTSYDPPAFIATGTYCYRRMVTDGCGTVAYSGTATFNVYADLASNTIVPSPISSSVCAGTAVSATFSGGSGGAPGLFADRDSVSTNGGTTWVAYAGGQINTTGLSGNNIVQIKTRRVAISVAGCDWGITNIYRWTVYFLPALFNVTGGGSYCTGGSGVNLGLSGSESGINYQLQIGGTTIGSAVAGTGGALSFGLQTTAGTYTVIATNATTGCQLQMSGSQTITIKPLPTTSPIYHR